MIPHTIQSQNEQADALYDKYALPLEASHRGQFIAVSPAGKFLLGDSLFELMQTAKTTLGQGNYIFKIGDRSVGKWL